VTRLTGFGAIGDCHARALVLGSLPGAKSLERGEYYAQPRNVFWRIMSELFGFALEEPYAARIAALIRKRVALWDVCAAAHRSGSLDTAIRNAEANPFEAFLSNHPQLQLIAFNGGKAAELFGKLVVPALSQKSREIATVVLPSTSPAHAAMPYAKKVERWRVVAQAAVAGSSGRRASCSRPTRH
jgi:double-stranded uracil-DNA glycosylase